MGGSGLIPSVQLGEYWSASVSAIDVGGAFFPLHPVSSPAEWRWSDDRHSCQIWSVGVMSLGRVRGTGPRWLPGPSPRASYLTLPPHVFWRDWFRTLLVGSSFLLPLYLLLSH